MTLIGFQTVLGPDAILESLHDHKYPATLELVQNDAISGEWEKQQFQMDDVLVECRRFPASHPAAKRMLKALGQELQEQSAETWLYEAILATCWITQTVKLSGEFEPAAELEYALQCCLSFAVEPKEGGAYWLFHSDNQLAIAATESTDPSEVIFRSSTTRFDQRLKSD